MRTKRVLATCGVLLFVAACGDNGAVGGQPAPFVEKSYAIAAGDAICKQFVADRQQLLDQLESSRPTPSEAEATDFFSTALLPRYDRFVGDMHRVGQPTKDKVEFDAALKALDNGLSDFKSEVADDPLAALKGTDAFDSANKKFADYGIAECGKLA